VGNKVFHWYSAAEYQLGGLFLQIYRGAITAEYRSLAHTYRCAGKLDTFFIGSLREKQYSRAGPRAGDGMFHQIRRRGGYNHQIGAAAFSQAADPRRNVGLARVPRFNGSTAARKIETAGDGIGGVDDSAGAGQKHREQQANRALSDYQYCFTSVRIALNYGFEAGVDGLDKAGAIEGDSVGDFLDAATDDPIHDAYILREAAAGRLVSGCHANFLIDRALGVDFAAAVETRHTGDVVEDHHAIANREIADTFTDLRHNARSLMTVDAWGSEKIVLDFLQIGVTDTAGFHAHEQLTRANLRSGHDFNRDDGLPLVHGGAHDPGYDWRR